MHRWRKGSRIRACGASPRRWRQYLSGPLDDPGRCGEPFDGANSLFEPPAIFGRPVLEPAVKSEIMGPVLRDVGIELRLPADGDEVGLPLLQDRFGLLGF